MNAYIARGAKRWMLCTATGLALLGPVEVPAAEPGSAAPPRLEPARFTPPATSRPVVSTALRNLLAMKKPGAKNSVPVQNADNRGGGAVILRTADFGDDDFSPVERELQKLYERDGRKMPPMRKPAAPNGDAVGGPQQRQFQAVPKNGGAPATLPEQSAQPIPPSKPSVMQKLNPFAKKPAVSPPNRFPEQPPQPPQQRPFAPAAQPQSTPSPAVGAASRTQPAAANEFSTSPRASQASGRSNAEFVPFSAPSPSRQGDDLANPFPDEPELQADGRNGTAPSAPPRPLPQSIPQPISRPMPPATLPSRPDADENPFTGVKLDDPPTRRPIAPMETPQQPEVRTPRAAQSVPETNPFAAPAVDAPSIERERSPRTPALEQPVDPDLVTPSPVPFAAPPAPPADPPSQPRLTVPDAQPRFEAPVRRTEPAPDTAPRLRAPEFSEERPMLTVPQPPAEPPTRSASPSRDAGWTPTRKASDEPASRLTVPMDEIPAPPPEQRRVVPAEPPRQMPRSLPPQTLDPEPAAELPRTPNSHERKLRMIAERKGAGLKGFCPVTLREERELVDGSPEFTSTYERRVYQFATAEAKRKFDREPAKYAPASGGNDVIVLGSFGREVPGSLDFALWYKDRLHLFSSRETLETFLETLGSAGAPKP